VSNGPAANAEGASVSRSTDRGQRRACDATSRLWSSPDARHGGCDSPADQNTGDKPQASPLARSGRRKGGNTFGSTRDKASSLSRRRSVAAGARPRPRPWPRRRRTRLPRARDRRAGRGQGVTRSSGRYRPSAVGFEASRPYAGTLSSKLKWVSISNRRGAGKEGAEGRVRAVTLVTLTIVRVTGITPCAATLVTLVTLVTLRALA